jgi:RHS repeat-associated protein
VTNDQGNKVQHYIYSAFGILLGIQDANAADVTSNAPIRTSYGFTGRERDQESGLMYYRARYYIPEVGRFLQRDPHPGRLAAPITLNNSYVYSGNDSTNKIDPTGMSFSLLNIFKGIGNLLAAIGELVAGVITTIVGSVYLLFSGNSSILQAGIYLWEASAYRGLAAFNYIIGDESGAREALEEADSWEAGFAAGLHFDNSPVARVGARQAYYAYLNAGGTDRCAKALEYTVIQESDQDFSFDPILKFGMDCIGVGQHTIGGYTVPWPVPK